jgi:hypothetical protein
MWDVRRRYQSDATPAPDCKNAAVVERSRRPVCKVADRNQRTDLPVYDLRFGRGREKVIHRATFVGFYMGESDPTQFLERDHRPHGGRYVGEHMAKARMKEKRFFTIDEKLIERETWTRGDERRNPIDSIGDFIDSCFHKRSSLESSLPALPGATLR